MNAHDFCLIVDNDRDLLRAWLVRAEFGMESNAWTAEAAEQFAEIGLEVLNQTVPSWPHALTMVAEIVRLALSRIDWQEVADHYRTKVEEGASA